MMKTKKVRLVMLCLLFASMAPEIAAQTHLDALIKKCETHKSVDMEVVKNKRVASENVETKSVNIRITNDKNLVNNFLDAFKKDTPNAEQAMFRKRKESNEINYYQCRFSNQTYTIIVKESGDANVTVQLQPHIIAIELPQEARMKQQQERMEQQQKARMKQQEARMKQQQARMKQQEARMKQQEARMKQQKERMKQQKERMKLHLDSTIIRHNIIADSLILKSTGHLNAINWDSITSKFGTDIDSFLHKMGSIEWDEILEKYEFE
jgi:hypothetical protein